MAYTVITKPTVGDAIKKSLVDALIDNSDFLYDNLGGGILVENGSFEQGVSPADPTGWVSFKWGTGNIETTDPLHGKQGYKFVSTGSGGGYLTMQDFAECSEFNPLFVWWCMKSSVADIKNIVRALWYKKDQTACNIASTDIYSENTENPTVGRRFGFLVLPPPDARYFKLRLIGADSSDVTPGSCIFDGVGVVEFSGESVYVTGTIAEDSTANLNWEDNGSVNILLPPLSADSHVRLTFRASSKVDATNTVYQRFRVDGEYSNESTVAQTAPTLPYVDNTFTLDLIGRTGGKVTVWQQLKIGGAGGSAYGKKEKPLFHIQILAW